MFKTPIDILKASERRLSGYASVLAVSKAKQNFNVEGAASSFLFDNGWRIDRQTLIAPRKLLKDHEVDAMFHWSLSDHCALAVRAYEEGLLR